MSRIANTVFDLIDKVHAAASVAGVWNVYTRAARDMGLAVGIAFFLPDDRSIGETTFANSMPSGWLENYVRQGHQENDPVIGQSHLSVSPFTWALSAFEDLNPAQCRWRDDVRAFGMEYGLIIPDRADGHLKIIALCGERCEMSPNDRRALHFAGLETLQRMFELGLEGAPPSFPALSARERECLHWIAVGKSDWEIGQILSISEKTVNTHIERAKTKMGVHTRTQAVVKAMREGGVVP